VEGFESPQANSSEHPNQPAPLTRARRHLYLAIALFFFLLAVVGVVLPIVPATPFLIVTSYFLARSFPKLNALLLRSPYFGPILYDWDVRKGVKTSVKLQAIATVVIGYAISILLFPIPTWAIILMCVLVSIGILVIARLPLPRDVPTTNDSSKTENAKEHSGHGEEQA